MFGLVVFLVLCSPALAAEIPVVGILNRTTGVVGFVYLSPSERISIEGCDAADGTLDSAIRAIQVVQNMQGMHQGAAITFDMHAHSVSGGSSSAAIAVAYAAMAANRSLKPYSSITGAVSEQGEIVEAGDILQKVMIAGLSGMDTYLVPDSQVITYIYEMRGGDQFSQDSYIMARRVNLTEYAARAFGMQVLGVSTLTEATEILLE